MLTTLDQLSRLFQTHHIRAEDVDILPIASSSKHAFVLNIEPAHEMRVWYIFRRLVQQTGRYPLLVQDWSNSRDFFSSYWYEHEQQESLIPDVTPEAILGTVPTADRNAYLRDQAMFAIDWEPEQTKEHLVIAPRKKRLKHSWSNKLFKTWLIWSDGYLRGSNKPLVTRGRCHHLTSNV